MNAAEHPVIIIAGPTASGKTALSYNVASQLPIEIINADMGQMYRPCSIGTAKPDWRKQLIPHHLFDIIDKPKDITVAQYRRYLLGVVQQVRSRGNVPVLVGGSFFYLKSLFYPVYATATTGSPPFLKEEQSEQLWNELHAIDPERAAQIHPNDHYRIQRALDIYKTTNIKPSEYVPAFNAPFSVHFIVLAPERSVLFERINQRTIGMMSDNKWLDEVASLRGTPWEPFLKRKKLIGYPELFAWFENGALPGELESVVARIQTLTRHYAKRQLCFWSTFKKQLELGFAESEFSCSIQEVREWDVGVISNEKSVSQQSG